MKRNEQKIENTWKTEDIFKDEAAFLACLISIDFLQSIMRL